MGLLGAALLYSCHLLSHSPQFIVLRVDVEELALFPLFHLPDLRRCETVGTQDSHRILHEIDDVEIHFADAQLC